MRVNTYRPAADRQYCDGSKIGGLVQIIQRTREEFWINNKVESCEFQRFPQTNESKVPRIYRKFIFSDGESRSKLKLSCS